MVPVVVLSALTACADDNAGAPAAAVTTTATTTTEPSAPSSTSPATLATPAPSTSAPAVTTTSTLPAPADLASLVDRFYQSTSTEGRDLVPGTAIWLWFSPGRIAAIAGCNSVAADAQLVGNQLIVDDRISGTLAGCSEPGLQQELWFQMFLTSDPTIGVDGPTVVLTSGSVALTFVDETAGPDRPLMGLWSIEQIVDHQGLAEPGAPGAFVMFGAGDSVNINTGCDSSTGPYEFDGTTVTVGALDHTGAGCADDAARLDASVLAVLQQPMTVHIAADRLTLVALDGTRLELAAHVEGRRREPEPQQGLRSSKYP